MRYIGIDPGVNQKSPGGVAYVEGDDIHVHYMPEEIEALYRLIQSVVHKPQECFVAVERQWPRPTDGRSSLFKLATNYGAIQMALTAAGVACVLVTPQEWKQSVFVSIDGVKDKKLSFETACRLYPDAGLRYKNKDHGLAEALMIARWASLQGP